MTRGHFASTKALDDRTAAQSHFSRRYAARALPPCARGDRRTCAASACGGHADRGEAQKDRADELAPPPHHRQEFLPAAHVAHGLPHRRLRSAQAELVVSAGGETHMPNICVARFLDIPSIFCGSLMRGLGPENFSLIVSSYDRDAASDRYLVTLKPSSIDPDALGRPASVPRYGPDLHPRLAGFLVGGNAGPFRYRKSGTGCLLSSPKSPRHRARAG